MCKTSPNILLEVYILGTEHNRKLKFRMQIYLTQMNIIFEYCHASVILDKKMGMHVGQF